MGDKTAIEWADATWNPLVGCTKVGSPGCEHCYAIDVVHRGMSNQHKGLTIKAEGERPDWNGIVREVPHLLGQPRRWQRPRRIFVNSLSDLFHADVRTHYIAQVFAVMADCERHTFQVLTKRPQRMASLLDDHEFWVLVNSYREAAPASAPRWLPNVWLGTSIENDRYSWRADHLRRLHPQARKFLSLEPLLGPLPSLDLTGIGWVIVGGESGHGARPMHPDWARDLRDRCRDDGIPFLFKQWGEWMPLDERIELDLPEAQRPWQKIAPDGESPTEYALIDGAATVVRVGKKTAGRVLDGVTWTEFPT